MNNNIVDFRFSDTDFATYLALKGFTPIYVEVIFDKKHEKLKAFTHFKEDRAVLIELQHKYRDGDAIVNLRQFSSKRKELNNIIRNKLNEYRLNNIFK